MKEIFEKEFILKVLLPLAIVMAYAAVTFLFAPFLLLIGMLIFACLFLFLNYSRGRLEEELSYEDEDTNPIGGIQQQIRAQDVSNLQSKKPSLGKLKRTKKVTSAPSQTPRNNVREEKAQSQPRKVVKKKVVKKVVRKQPDEKKENLNYDDDFEFEFGSFDE